MKTRTLGLLAALLVVTPVVYAQDKKSDDSAIPVLLALDPVRQELDLSPVQCGLLDDLALQFKTQAKDITAIGMADQDAALRANWDLQTLRGQFTDRALAVLTTSQMDRLHQIERQVQGGSLLVSVSEQKLLGLSPQQQQALASLVGNDQKLTAAIMSQFKSGQLSSYQKTSSLRRNQQSMSKQMLEVLTPQQKKQWEEISGRKLALPDIHDPDANTKSLFEGY